MHIHQESLPTLKLLFSFVGCLCQKTEDLASHSYFDLLPVQGGGLFD